MTPQSVMSVLSPEQRKCFERDGYVIFDPEISGHVLDGVLRDVEGKYLYEEGKVEIDEHGVVYQPGARPRIMNAWKGNDDVRARLFSLKPLPAPVASRSRNRPANVPPPKILA